MGYFDFYIMIYYDIFNSAFSGGAMIYFTGGGGILWYFGVNPVIWLAKLYLGKCDSS